MLRLHQKRKELMNRRMHAPQRDAALGQPNADGSRRTGSSPAGQPKHWCEGAQEQAAAEVRLDLAAFAAHIHRALDRGLKEPVACLVQAMAHPEGDGLHKYLSGKALPNWLLFAIADPLNMLQEIVDAERLIVHAGWLVWFQPRGTGVWIPVLVCAGASAGSASVYRLSPEQEWVEVPGAQALELFTRTRESDPSEAIARSMFHAGSAPLPTRAPDGKAVGLGLMGAVMLAHGSVGSMYYGTWRASLTRASGAAAINTDGGRFRARTPASAPVQVSSTR